MTLCVGAMAASAEREVMTAARTGSNRPSRPTGMSYKFQRLREKIRRAIATGELSGKLPGERALARRFHVNAKTLSKALTDLAAEGVLDRSIGRGTYVKGSAPATPAHTGKWLLLCDPGDQSECLIEHLRRSCPDLQTACSADPMRPSFLNQFNAVIDLALATPETLLRDLLVRNMPVIAVNHEPKAYSMHAVLVDVALGVSRLGRDLLLAGHRRLGAVEPKGGTAVSHALRQAVTRYTVDATVEACDPSEAASMPDAGITALVCGSVKDTREVLTALAARNIPVPGQVSVVAVGCTCPMDCSGYFVECRQIADTVVAVLRENQPRPVSLWLAGTWLDRGSFVSTGGGLNLEATAGLRVSGVDV